MLLSLSDRTGSLRDSLRIVRKARKTGGERGEEKGEKEEGRGKKKENSCQMLLVHKANSVHRGFGELGNIHARLLNELLNVDSRRLN